MNGYCNLRFKVVWASAEPAAHTIFFLLIGGESSGNALVIAYSIKMKFLLLVHRLTEVWRTRPNGTCPGGEGMAESSVPG